MTRFRQTELPRAALLEIHDEAAGRSLPIGERVAALLASGVDAVVLDLGGVRHIGSDDVGQLIAGYLKCFDAGVGFRVVTDVEQHWQALEQCSLVEVLGISRRRRDGRLGEPDPAP